MSEARGGAVRVAAACGWVERDDAVYVAALPDGPPLVLEGSGSLVWRALLDGGTVAEVVDRVAEATGESAAAVAPAVTRFLGDLSAAGVLDPLGPVGAPGPAAGTTTEE